MKNTIKKSFILLFVLVTLIQNIQSVEAANKLTIREVVNEYGEYYGVDINKDKLTQVEIENNSEEEIENSQETDELALDDEEIYEANNVEEGNHETTELDENEMMEEGIDISSMLQLFTFEEETQEEENYEFLEAVDQYSSVYVNIEDNNLKKLVISQKPMNYEVEDGFKPIDVEIVPEVGGDISTFSGISQYSNSTNGIQTVFDMNINTGWIKFAREAESFTLRPKLTQVGDKLIQDSQIIYPLENEMALKYQIYPNEVVQELICLNELKTNIIEFNIITSNLDSFQKNEKVEFYTPGISIPRLEIAAPVVVDNEGKVGVVTVTYDGFNLKYEINQSFLNNAVYPITLKTSIKAIDNYLWTYAHMGKDISVAYNFASSTIGNITSAELESNGWVLPPNKQYEAYMFLGNSPYQVDGTALQDSYSFYKLLDDTFDFYELEDKYIKKAVLSLPVKAIGDDATVYSCTISGTYDIETATYNTLSYPLEHSNCTSKSTVKKTDTYAFLTITDYVKSVVEENKNNNGVMLLLENKENNYVTFNAQEYYYIDNESGDYPSVVIYYYDNPDVGNMDVKDFTFHVRPFTKYKYETGLAHFTVFGVDGVSPVGSKVKVKIIERESNAVVKQKEMDVVENFYLYPDYPVIEGTQNYTEVESNYQLPEYYGNSGADNQDVFKYNQVYDIEVTASKNGVTETKQTWFQLYEVKTFDVLSSVAIFYGVELDVLIADNNLQDQLIVEGNVLFIREPKRNLGIAYETKDLSEDDMKEIDAALVGRGLQCEFGFEPINFNTGNFLFESSDASISVLDIVYELDRTYNSKNADYLSVFGYGWSYSFDYRVTFNLDRSLVTVIKPNGQQFLFEIDNSGNYVNKLNAEVKLNKNGDYFTFSTTTESIEFNRNGTIKQLTTRNGNKTNYYYGSNGLLEFVELSNTQKITMVYNEDTLVSEMLLPDGSKVSYEYDDNLNLIAFYDQSGNKVSYEYNTTHDMTSWTNRNGQLVVSNEYDAEHRVVKQTDGLDAIFLLEYFDDKTVITDAQANQEIITFDAFKQTTSRKNLDGQGKEYKFVQGLLVEEILENGITFEYEYDGAYLTKITRNDGYVEEIQYDSNYNPIYLIEAGNATAFEFDTKGNVIKTTDVLGNETTAIYNENNQLLKETNAIGVSTYYEYDALGRKIKITHDNGDYVSYTYNELGFIASETDSFGLTKTYTHSDRNELIRIDYNDGTFETREYDASGNLIKEVNRNGYTTETKYNIYGNVIEEKDGNGNVTTFEYDKNQRLIKTLTASGAEIIYQYDSQGRVVEQTNNGITTKTVYNSLGQVEQEIDERNNVTQYFYDSLGNTIKTIYPNLTTMETKYNSLGQMIESIDVLGNKTEYVYDVTGNVIEEKTDQYINYTVYNSFGNVVETRKVTVDSEQIVKKEYNNFGQLVEETDSYGNVKQYTYKNGHLIETIDELNNKETYKYDLNGRIVEISYSNGTKEQSKYDGIGNLVEYINQNNEKTSFKFDGNNNQVEQSIYLSDGRVATTRYEYNSWNMISKEISPEGIISEYEYDVYGYLKQIKKNGVIQSIFIVNEYGEVIEETVNGLVTKYEYDEFGRRTKDIQPTGLEKVYEYNELGQIVRILVNGIETEVYSYDNYGRVLTVTDQFNIEKEYTYNSDGNIIKLIQTNQPIIYYGYDSTGSRIVEERDSLGNVSQYSYDTVGNVIEHDYNGNKATAIYDNYSRKISETNTLGYTTTYAYDVLGRKISSIDALGVESRMVYNELNQSVETYTNDILMSTSMYDLDGNLLYTIDAMGYKTQYKYNAFGELIMQVDALGNPTYFSYDSNHNLIEEKNALGYKTKYEYNELNQKTAVIDANGNSTSYSYDIYNNIIEVVYSNGAKTSNEYNQYNQLVGTMDVRGLVTENIYDSYGRLIEVRINGITTSKTTYDEYNRVVEELDSYGNSKKFIYSKEGQISEETDVFGNRYHYEYDSEGQTIKIIGATGVDTKIEYDALGQTIKTVLNGERISESTYDSFGNVITESRNGVIQFTNEYDNNNQLIKTTNALGHSQESVYNEVGLIVKQIEASGATTEYVYDAIYNQIQVKTALGNINTYQYDKVGNILYAQNPRGYWYSYEYDSAGNLIKEFTEQNETKYNYAITGDLLEVVYDDGKKEQYQHDVYGNIVSVTQKDKTIISYEYDNHGNLIQKNNIIYSYDNYGNRIEITNSSSSIQIKYDPFTNPSEMIQNGEVTKYYYNEYHELEKLIYPDGTEVNYLYNNLGQLISVTTPQGEITYQYDDLGQQIKEIQSNGIIVLQTYDVIGNLIKKETTQNGLVLSNFEYEYNLENSVVKEVRTQQDEELTYYHEYNENDELVKTTEESADGVSTIEYIISIDGNKIEVRDGKSTKTSEYNNYNQQVKYFDGSYTYTYSYDDNGNRIEEKRSDGKTKTYEYDEYNQLIKVIDFDHTIVKYSYDGLGNRIEQLASRVHTLFGTEEKKVSDSYKTLIKKIEYVNDQNYCEVYFYGENEGEEVVSFVPITKKNESIELEDKIWYETEVTVIKYTNDLRSEYVQVLSTKQDNKVTNIYYGTNRISTDERIYTYDGYGNVIQDISHQGGLLESYRYTAYGNRDIVYNPFNRNSEYGYRGEAHTFDNLQYLRARYYHTVNEQFIQEDAYRGELSDPLSRNRYTYVLNNPYKYSDPSGNVPGFPVTLWNGNYYRSYGRLEYSVSKKSYGPWLPYSGTFKGLLYAQGFLYTGKYNGYVVEKGKCIRKIRNGWIGNHYYKDDILMYSRPGTNPPTPWENNGSTGDGDTNGDSNSGTPTFTQTGTQMPIIVAETPRVDSAQMTNDTKNLIQKAAASEGVSVKMMEEMLYAMIANGSNGLDFPKFLNQAHLEARIRELCNKIIEANKDPGKSTGESLLDGLQTILDWIGFIPGIGDIADAINAIIYYLRGNTLLAIISIACIILPLIADAILKPIKAVAKTALEFVQHAIPKVDNFITLIKNGIKALKDKAVGIVKNFGEKLAKTVGEGFEKLGKYWDELVEKLTKTSIWDQGMKVLKNFNLDDIYVKVKHLASTSGNGAKFLADTIVDASSIVKEAITNGKVIDILDNGITAMGNQSYQIFVDAGKIIGTKGQTVIMIVLSSDGGIISIYPVFK